MRTKLLIRSAAITACLSAAGISLETAAAQPSGNPPASGSDLLILHLQLKKEAEIARADASAKRKAAETTQARIKILKERRPTEGSDAQQAFDSGIAALHTQWVAQNDAADKAALNAELAEAAAKSTETAVATAGVQPPQRLAVCRMATLADFDKAFLNTERIEAPLPGERDLDGGMEECFNVAGRTIMEEKDEARRAAGRLKGERAEALAFSIAQVLPDRPNQQPGLTAALAISNGARASATFTQPFIFRSVGEIDEKFASQAPQLLTVSIGAGVPIEKGKATIASRAGGQSDFASGISARIGIDFYSFQRFGKEVIYRRTVDLLFRAMEKCAAEKGVPKVEKTVFYAHYGVKETYDRRTDGLVTPVETLAGRTCTGDDLLLWMLEVERDTSLTDGYKLKRPALASEYWSLFWDNGPGAIPTYGWGASYERTWNRFKVHQAQLSLQPDPTNPGKVLLVPDRTVPLVELDPIKHQNHLAQAYLSGFLRTRDNPFQKPRGVYTDGLMLLLSGGYEVVWDYRQGNLKDFSVCNVPPAGTVYGSCTTRNIDVPYRRAGWFLGAESRVQFNNVPYLDLIGLAPKLTWRLSDDRKTLDVPVYLTANDKGLGTTGVRFVHNWDGADLLGNKLEKDWEVSVFFSSTLDFLGL